MYRYHRTSIFTSNAQTVVNTVNTVGIMGKGLAAEFKKRYPDMYERYRELCKKGEFKIGQLWLWKATDQWILNFPTKQHWRQPSKISYVEAGLQKFVETYQARGITEISFPRLGCGNGGLDWKDVKPLMEHYLKRLPINVYVHDYEKNIGAPEHLSSIANGKQLSSFEDFLELIQKSISLGGDNLETLANRSKFRAELDANENLLFVRPGGRDIVSKNDLLELWQLLLRGPVTRQRLPGRARDAAYYLFPLLSRIPQIRPIELGTEDNVSAMAIELNRRSTLPKDVLAQDELQWE